MTRTFRGVARAFVRCTVMAAAAMTLVSLSVERASGQQPTPQPRAQAPRRQATIEIRGQVPTPQVVTVRPRETPTYSRRVLVPAFFDHDFWPSILPPLEIVSPPAATRSDTTSRSAADSAARARSSTRSPSGTPPAPLRR
jgi:hypothetical protein